MNSSPSSAAIIAGAGMGHRLGADIPKALIQLDGITLVERAFAALSKVVDEIVITAPAGYEEEFQRIVGESAKVITGGVLRSDSVNLALNALSPSVKYVLVHDAARALATEDLAFRVLQELKSGASAVIPAVNVVDTIKEVDRDGFVRSTPDRAALRAIQTPQGFEVSVLRRAHEASADATDDAALVEALGIKVKTIAGEARAMKITNPEDLAVALTHLRNLDSQLRVGVGTDAHAFSSDPNRQLWLGGILWSDVVGVDGHSDGDVAAHAICDALFSATGLGDLGSNFGTADPKYAGASGVTLLQETLARITAAGYAIQNVAVQIVCNKPKIGSRRSEAIAALSQALGGAPVSVTATSTDGLGFTGEGKGISAIATALVQKSK
ncbi:MAG: 2-C-methyl-D-erythritol 4-phosphate cytidylyltransferase [Candidatus Nanopelagicaceae bacterium]|nr:2-C-methyl-D-erythritol 4-phosphate cytidylyltransferase [Candidatus Nanopelagicaceae bacterium]